MKKQSIFDWVGIKHQLNWYQFNYSDIRAIPRSKFFFLRGTARLYYRLGHVPENAKRYIFEQSYYTDVVPQTKHLKLKIELFKKLNRDENLLLMASKHYGVFVASSLKNPDDPNGKVTTLTDHLFFEKIKDLSLLNDGEFIGAKVNRKTANLISKFYGVRLP